MITIEEVREQVKEVLVRNFPQFADSMTNFSDEAPLRSARLQLDSIDLLLLVLELEKKFGIRIVSNEFDEKIWSNVNSLARAIQERILTSQSFPDKV
jgi:acyl carrier protein